MSIAQTSSALTQAFLDGNFLPVADIQFENTAFTPPQSRLWAAFHFLPAQPSLATLGDGGTDAFTGLIQIDLNYPLNRPVGPQREKAEAIKARLKAGARFSYEGLDVKITSSGYGPGREVDGFHRVGLSIYFETRIQR